MADEETALVEEGEGATPLEEEGQTTTAVEEEAQPDPVASLATELGWVPKDQFRGESEWVPADEFIRKGRDIQRNLSRDLREVRSTVENMSRTSAALLEQQLERQRTELEARFNAAVEEGDPEAARAVRGQIDKLETAPQAKAPPPEALAFVEKHSSWFNKDPDATAYARARCDHYAAMGMSPTGQLAAAERDVKDMFPTLFPAPTKAAAAVAAPASRTAGNSGRQKSFHDLPTEAQAVAKDMVERCGIKMEDYVANYFAKPERKVG